MSTLRKIAALGVLTISFSASLHAKDRLTIDSVDGDGSVVIFSSNHLTVHTAKKGEEIEYWDVIQTSRLSSAKVRYPDGSVVVVGRDSKFTIQPKQEGTQYNQLEWGQVRAQVEKEKNPSPKAPPRFVIRTKTATMGVRGTDFVAGFDAMSGASSLHTIEGTVDIATGDSQVLAWKGTPVTAGHAVSLSTAAEPITVAEFKPQEYKEKIKTEQPELGTLPDRAPAGVGGENPGEGVPNVSAPLNGLKPENEEARLKIMRFRLGSVSILQDAGQGTKVAYTTVAPSWNPTLRAFGPVSLVAQVSGYLIKNVATGSSVPTFMGGVSADLDALGPFHLEAGGGMQTWMTDSAGMINKPYVMGDVVWEFAPGKWLDTIYVGGSKIIDDRTQGLPTSVFAGVGLRF